MYRIRDSYNKEELRKAEEEKRKALLLPDKISCHVMRHTFCTRLCEHTDSIDVIMYIMGHSDIRTTVNTPKGHTPPTAAIFDIIVKIQQLVKRWVVLQEIF